MKIRFTGSSEDFKKLKVDTLDRSNFISFRLPQLGGNPSYMPGGKKYNPSVGEQLLMYVEVDIETLKKMLRTLRVKKIKLPLERMAPKKPIKKTTKTKKVTKKQSK